MTRKFDFAAGQTQGKRDYQEDFFLFSTPSGENPDPETADGLVAVLADGMGGHAGGRMASHLAAEAFVERFGKGGSKLKKRLKASLVAGNDAIADRVEAEPDLEGMGTTLIGAVVDEHTLNWISVGDSLLYLYRDGVLNRINEDHSLAPQLDARAKAGEITQEQARNHSDRNALLSAVVGGDIELVDNRGKGLELEAGDWIIVASDGLQTLSDEEIAGVVDAHFDESAQDLVDALLEEVEARDMPRQDNTTIMALREVGRQNATTIIVRRDKKPAPEPDDKSDVAEVEEKPKAPATQAVSPSAQSQAPKAAARVNTVVAEVPFFQRPIVRIVFASLAILLIIAAFFAAGVTNQMFAPRNTSIQKTPKQTGPTDIVPPVKPIPQTDQKAPPKSDNNATPGQTPAPAPQTPVDSEQQAPAKTPGTPPQDKPLPIPPDQSSSSNSSPPTSSPPSEATPNLSAGSQ